MIDVYEQIILGAIGAIIILVCAFSYKKSENPFIKISAVVILIIVVTIEFLPFLEDISAGVGVDDIPKLFEDLIAFYISLLGVSIVYKIAGKDEESF